MATETSVPTSHRRLLHWVDEAIERFEPDDVHWCDGSAGEYDRLCRMLVEQGTFTKLCGGQATQLPPRALRPRRRGPRRGPDVHLLRARGGRGADEQLARAGRDARAAGGAVRRLHARPHALRRALLDGAAGLADLRDRRPAHRLALRRGLDADHDPDGQRRARAARRRRRLRALPAHDRRAARRGRGERDVAVQRGEVHRPLPRDARDLVLRLGLRRQRAAGEEVLRAADRLGHGPRRGLDGRAHADPQAHVARGRGQVRHRRVPERVRQDQPRDAHPRRSRAGRWRPSATTSRG